MMLQFGCGSSLSPEVLCVGSLVASVVMLEVVEPLEAGLSAG
jgi:hypothetical protein